MYTVTALNTPAREKKLLPPNCGFSASTVKQVATSILLSMVKKEKKTQKCFRDGNCSVFYDQIELKDHGDPGC